MGLSTLKGFLSILAAASLANGYWLMGVDPLTHQRIDPIVNPGKVAGHAHLVFGGSNFGLTTNSQRQRESECTTTPIPQDKSVYWVPQLYFQWQDGKFESVDGGAVIYYLFPDKPGATTAFPDDFRMLSGDPLLRTYDPSSHAQQAITFLCLDFKGTSTTHAGLPLKNCPDGIRAQVNFPSCWDGKNVDSSDHKSHVAFRSGGPDSGECNDPKYPISLPRIFLEVYFGTGRFNQYRNQGMNTTQPFVFSNGDPSGYGYHGDFFMGWERGVLQNAVDKCTCNIYGDPTCCADQGIFKLNKEKKCKITNTVDEQVLGTLDKLPGNNPVQKEGTRAKGLPDTATPPLLNPVYVYYGDKPDKVGTVSAPGGTPSTSAAPSSATSSVAVTSAPASSAAPSSAPPSSAPASSPAPSPSASDEGDSERPASSAPYSSQAPSSTPSSEAPSSTPYSSEAPSSTPYSEAPASTPYSSEAPASTPATPVYSSSAEAPHGTPAPPSNGDKDGDDEEECDDDEDDEDEGSKDGGSHDGGSDDGSKEEDEEECDEDEDENDHDNGGDSHNDNGGGQHVPGGDSNNGGGSNNNGGSNVAPGGGNNNNDSSNNGGGGSYTPGTPYSPPGSPAQPGGSEAGGYSGLCPPRHLNNARRSQLRASFSPASFYGHRRGAHHGRTMF